MGPFILIRDTLEIRRKRQLPMLMFSYRRMGKAVDLYRPDIDLNNNDERRGSSDIQNSVDA